MSTILNELVKIREKLDSDGTYSGSTAGVPETVTQIRELVENGAGGGSGGGKVFETEDDDESGLVVKATQNEMEPGALAIVNNDDGSIAALLCMAIDGAMAIFLAVESDGIVTQAYQYVAEKGCYVKLPTIAPGGGGLTPPVS